MRCSLRCAHCAASAGEALPNELGTRQALAMLKALADFGVKSLCVSGGEPTMRPDWERLLREALRRFEEVRLLTNGRLGAALLRRVGRMAGRERLTVVVSLDGRRAAHDARRGAGSYASVLAALDAPSPVAREVISTIARDNLSEVDALARLCTAHGVRCWTLQPALAMGRLDSRDSLGARGPALIAAAVKRISRRLGPRLQVHTSDQVRRLERGWRCPAAREKIVILADGTIVGCQFLADQPAGDIRRVGLRRAWDGPALRRVRAAA